MFFQKAKKALQLPFPVLLEQVAFRIKRLFKKKILFLKEKNGKTYSISKRNYSFLGVSFSFDFTGIDQDLFFELGDRYLSHRFEIFQNEWVNWNDEVLASSSGLNSKTSSHYTPIKWSWDPGSNYSWPVVHHSQILVRPCSDEREIKVPWEIGRCHHFSILSSCYAISKEDLYALEIIDQIYDFMNQNPPSFGVQWLCAMDVAIRISNWILSIEMLNSTGFKFDESFLKDFRGFVLDHQRYIENYIEWNPELRANHYLSDLAGLLFCSLALNDDRRFQKYSKEFKKEIKLQFHLEGSSFEGSSCYHRLSAEIAVYGLALIAGQEKKLEEEFVKLLHQMAHFTWALTKPTGEVIQVGDHDSGRFFKASPVILARSSLLENFLDHTHLLESISGFFEREQPLSLEAQWIFFLLKGKTFEQVSFLEEKKDIISTLDWSQFSDQRQWKIPVDPKVFEQMETFYFTEFGIYIWKSPRFYLSFRCGTVGQKGYGGHSHNDQLSINLQIDGQEIVSDPGTGTYTAKPKVRNLYRSVESHFCPQWEGVEPGQFDVGLFQLGNAKPGTVIHLEKNKISGELRLNDDRLVRDIFLDLDQSQIVIRDGSRKKKLSRKYDLIFEDNHWKTKPDIFFSRGYGHYR